MTYSTHVTLGAAIGFMVGNPLLGFVLGVISHLLVDMIPHGDVKIVENYRNKKKRKPLYAYMTIDAIIAVYIVLGVSQLPLPTSSLAFIAAVVGATLPDLLVGAYEIKKTPLLKWCHDIHFFFHDFFSKRYGDAKLSYSLAGQALVILLILNVL